MQFENCPEISTFPGVLVPASSSKLMLGQACRRLSPVLGIFLFPFQGRASTNKRFDPDSLSLISILFVPNVRPQGPGLRLGLS